MKIAKAWPPNYDTICVTFKIRGNRNVIFTYGDTVYVPSGLDLPDHLVAHEQTHIDQQAKMGAAEWWGLYLDDSYFRLNQEVQAYRAQYRCLKANYPRQQRKVELAKISRDLAGEMYGKIISKAEAKELITDETSL